MTSLQKRLEKLMPNGKPKYVRIYDHPTVADRYTVVYTGNYNNLRENQHEGYGKIHYVRGMSTNPYHPYYGVSSFNEYEHIIIDRPRYSHLGKKIKFDDLPKLCQDLVIEDYKDIWMLNKRDNAILELKNKQE